MEKDILKFLFDRWADRYGYTFNERALCTLIYHAFHYNNHTYIEFNGLDQYVCDLTTGTSAIDGKIDNPNHVFNPSAELKKLRKESITELLNN
jgi:hypothetical protein